MDKAADVKATLAAFSRPEQEATFAWFFKTGAGQYGEGDVFIGAKVPETRSVAKLYKNLASHEIDELLASQIHEERQCGLFILVGQFKRAKTTEAQQEFFDHYLNLVYEGRVNNWDLVDATAPYLGAFLIGKPDALKLLTHLARSEKLWERRVAIIFTFAFIRVGEFKEALEIAEILNEDKHDLIHKAVGWMLREVGKKDIAELRKYLSRFAATMPRTALRYAIEKMDEPERKRWMAEKTKLPNWSAGN
jgi:3-methyladenine DNA glycosylase AlkD